MIPGKAGVTLARSTADFPDEVGERCVMTVTIPEAIAAGSASADPRLSDIIFSFYHFIFSDQNHGKNPAFVCRRLATSLNKIHSGRELVAKPRKAAKDFYFFLGLLRTGITGI